MSDPEVEDTTVPGALNLQQPCYENLKSQQFSLLFDSLFYAASSVVSELLFRLVQGTVCYKIISRCSLKTAVL
jgi:hypothetical protein